MEQQTEYCPRSVENGEITWRPDDTCSYCGSLSEDAFFAALSSGQMIEPTDKNYKVYIGNKKFYFQHLSSEGKTKFINLLNGRLISIAAPGYFYVTPYFLRTD